MGLVGRVCRVGQVGSVGCVGCWLGLTQPRVNDLLKGRISKFSLDALVNLSTHAHYRIDISVVEDETAPA